MQVLHIVQHSVLSLGMQMLLGDMQKILMHAFHFLGKLEKEIIETYEASTSYAPSTSGISKLELPIRR